MHAAQVAQIILSSEVLSAPKSAGKLHDFRLESLVAKVSMNLISCTFCAPYQPSDCKNAQTSQACVRPCATRKYCFCARSWRVARVFCKKLRSFSVENRAIFALKILKISAIAAADGR